MSDLLLFVVHRIPLRYIRSKKTSNWDTSVKKTSRIRSHESELQCIFETNDRKNMIKGTIMVPKAMVIRIFFPKLSINCLWHLLWDAWQNYASSAPYLEGGGGGSILPCSVAIPIVCYKKKLTIIAGGPLFLDFEESTYSCSKM